MKSLLIHGCYDQNTLKTLIELGVQQFAFDLRGRSPNLVPFNNLKQLLQTIIDEKVILTFENDKEETVLSFLNLLKDEPQKFILEFRDSRPASYYHSFNRPFIWMFHPDADWETILNLKNLRGVLLPLKYQDLYQTLPRFWATIDSNEVEIFLHAENFDEANFLSSKSDIQISLDLCSEIESGFRSVDQDRLKNMKFWRNINEHSARQ